MSTLELIRDVGICALVVVIIVAELKYIFGGRPPTGGNSAK